MSSKSFEDFECLLVEPVSKKRGKYFNKYTEKNVQEAIRDIEMGSVTIYQASIKYNIPYNSLRNRLKGKSSDKHGRSQVLNVETERKLSEWILQSAALGDPKTKDEVLIVAASCSLLTCGKEKGFKKNLPSQVWLKSFIKRNPTVTFRTPSSLTRASANVSKHNIVSFIEHVREQLKSMIGEENFEVLEQDPTAWGNSDETGFELNPVPSKVLAAKGAKNVYRVETAKPKETISVMYTFLASGKMLAPQLILKKSLSSLPDMAHASGGKYVNHSMFLSILIEMC